MERRCYGTGKKREGALKQADMREGAMEQAYIKRR